MILDEEVRELLREVARDSSSMFFGTVAQEATAATLNVESVSAGTAGWTAAERKLIEGYRDVLAEALIGVFRGMAASEAGAIDFVGSRQPPRHEPRTDKLVRSPLFHRIDPTLRPVVEAIAAGCGHGLAVDTVTHVVRQLRDDDRSANLHGMALILAGKHVEAARLLRKVYEESLRPSVRYYAALNLALAIAMTDAPLEETLPSLCAAVRDEPGAPALCSAMVNGCLVGNNELAELSAAYLDDRFHPGDVDVVDVIAAYHERSWSEDERRGLSGLRSKVGFTPGRILDAILV